MKRTLLFVALLFFFSFNFQAQKLEGADLLFSQKKYMEAANMYFQQYQFNMAVKAYQMQIDEYMKGKKPQPQAADSIKPLLKQAEKAQRMLTYCEDIQIIDSVVVDKNNFLKSYFTGEGTGTFEQTNSTVIYQNQLKDRRYSGKKNKNGFFRLYYQTKIQDQWTEEKPLSLPDDSVANDNFPFVMPDGLTIYYASTGNGSIGGYDLFVSRYNLNNDTYLAPNQLGMPFNSIYNDYMLVIDEVNGIGYFATDRFQPKNKVVIYTFIPNDEVNPIGSDNETVLRNRAMITSIVDSWIPNANYRSKLEKIKAGIKTEQQEVKKDFTFVINDNIVYHTLSDFENGAAKKSFLQSQEMEENIRTLENQLDAQRKSFAEGDEMKKQSLRAPILANEKQLETMLEKYKQLLVETRNSEIKHLRIKN